MTGDTSHFMKSDTVHCPQRVVDQAWECGSDTRLGKIGEAWNFFISIYIHLYTLRMIKHTNWKCPVIGGFHGNIIYRNGRHSETHCHVWLSEGVCVCVSQPPERSTSISAWCLPPNFPVSNFSAFFLLVFGVTSYCPLYIAYTAPRKWSEGELIQE